MGGENVKVEVPKVLMNQLIYAGKTLVESVNEYKENHTEAELKDVMESTVPEIWGKLVGTLSEKYYSARNEVEADVEAMKKMYRSQSKDRYKTKADVLKAVWAELPKYSEKPVPPIDDEFLAELEQIPAVREGEFRHIWGTADTLYKSEAIDSFGQKYLLGIYETKDEAKKAFEEWNAEYEQGRRDMRAEMEQWSKQENAKLEGEEGSARIQKILEEARR